MRHWVFWGGHSVMGSKHDHNQDAWTCVGNNLVDGTLIVVADGVSSVKFGALTAQKTCEFFLERASQKPYRLVDDICEDIVQISNRIEEELGRGKGACTLSILWLYRDDAYLLSLGDSPIFLVRDNTCLKLTSEKHKSGRLREFIGMGKDISEKINRRKLDVKPNDCFILTTDGVAETLKPKDFALRWSHCYQDPVVCSRHLVELAEAMGSDDDNTVVSIYLPRLWDYSSDDIQEIE